MVEGNASMYLGSPRMAEMVIGQKTTLEEMGGAKMHCSVSGCGDALFASEPEAIASARHYLAYLPLHADGELPEAETRDAASSCDDLEDVIPAEENRLFDMRKVMIIVLFVSFPLVVTGALALFYSIRSIHRPARARESIYACADCGHVYAFARNRIRSRHQNEIVVFLCVCGGL